MVQGLDKFKEYFGDYTGQYVFIGGTACDILLDDLGAPFRATKDLDMVLLIEALDEEFGNTFWKFIEDGGYQHKQKSTGEDQFYRFSKPIRTDFPAMIELFSRKSEKIKLHFDSLLTPIHISDNITSLSAILLNDAYYELLIQGKEVIDGVSVLSIEYILLFKMKAWMDLLDKKNNGEHINSKDITKHKNDIFRLLIYILPFVKVEINDEVHEDLIKFTDMILKEKVDLKKLGIRNVSFNELIDRIKIIYYRNTVEETI